MMFIFHRLSMFNVQALSRVVAVSGDITEARLGLCEEEENVLAQTVSRIVFIVVININVMIIITIINVTIIIINVITSITSITIIINITIITR